MCSAVWHITISPVWHCTSLFICFRPTVTVWCAHACTQVEALAYVMGHRQQEADESNAAAGLSGTPVARARL